MSGRPQDRSQQQQSGQQPAQPRFQYYGGAQQGSQPNTPPFQPRPQPFQPGAPAAASQQSAPHYAQGQPAPQSYPQAAYGSYPGYGQPAGYQEQAGYQQQQHQQGYAQQQQQPGYGPAHSSGGPAQGLLDGQNALMANLAGSMLQQQGASYLQKGQAFMQQRMGFLSSSLLQSYFSVGGGYVPNKLLLLLTPYMKRWTYVRELEQISGGNKYLPPRQDVNAPDLYIPLCALFSYVVMAAMVAVGHKRFSPNSLYSSASSAWAAWLLHTVLLKALLYVLGLAAAVPWLELACYAGYPFVAVCLAMAGGVLPLGVWVYRAAWGYVSLCMAVFMVRTLKRVIFYECRQYSMESKSHNYILLGLGAFQFAFTAWLVVLK